MSIHDKDMHQNRDGFDSAMRTLHREALASVSPQVRWKLRPATAAPRAAEAGRFGDWRIGTAYAGVAAAVFALALGLGMWQTPNTATPAATPTTALADADSATTLEQDPDFYAWLASDDADLVAME